MRHLGLNTQISGDIHTNGSTPLKHGNTPEPAKEHQAGNLIPLNYNTVSDEVLVELYQTNSDEAALSNIIDRYRDPIFGFAVKMTKNHSDAEDVFQEISLTLVKNLHSFKGNSKFSTWLYRVTLNACYMKLNKRNKTKNHELKQEYVYDNAAQGTDYSGQWTHNPLSTALYKESAGLLNKALHKLSKRNRKIIVLKDMEGYSNAEVARKLGISIPAVKSSLLRSRLTLRKKLGTRFRERF